MVILPVRTYHYGKIYTKIQGGTDMKKWYFPLLAIVLVITLFVGCAQTGKGITTSKNSASGTSVKAPAKVSIWFYPEADSLDEVLGDQYSALVKKLNSNIALDYQMLSFDSGPQKLTVAMASNTTPDIYMDGYSRISPAITANKTVDVTDLVSDIKPYILDNSQNAGVVNGKNMAVTYEINPAYCILVNLTLAKKLGIENMLLTDWMHWSYDDFLNICRAAKKADSGIVPIALWAGSKSSDAWYYSWLIAGGTDITNKDMTATAFNTPQAVTTLNVFKTIVTEGLCQAGASTTIDQDADKSFYSGKALFDHAGFNNAPTLYSEMQSGECAKFDFDAYAIPTPNGKADPYVATWGPECFIIFKNHNDAKTIDAAKKVVKTFYDHSDICKGFADKTGVGTTAKEGQPTFATDQLKKLNDRSNAYTAKYGKDDIGILEGWWTDFRQTFYVQMQGLYTGKQTAQEVLDNWQKAGDQVIAKANNK
jgi:multiple sugar transport system substrate-binding protein